MENNTSHFETLSAEEASQIRGGGIGGALFELGADFLVNFFIGAGKAVH